MPAPFAEELDSAQTQLRAALVALNRCHCLYAHSLSMADYHRIENARGCVRDAIETLRRFERPNTHAQLALACEKR